MPKVVLAAGVGVAVAVLVPLPSAVLAFVAGAAYGAVVLLTRAVPPELFDALRGPGAG